MAKQAVTKAKTKGKTASWMPSQAQDASLEEIPKKRPKTLDEMVEEDKLVRAKRIGSGIHPDSLPINPKIPNMVYLKDIPPGGRFLLYHGKEWYGAETYGTVTHQSPGMTSVRLDLKEAKKIEFRRLNGEDGFQEVAFKATRTPTSEWSPGTLVIKVSNLPRGASGRDAQIEGEEMAKTMNVMTKTTGKTAGKASTSTTASAPKAKGTGRCLCGCGTEVNKNFAQGHDARFHGWVKKVQDGRLKLAEIPKLTNGSEEGRKNVEKALKAGH